jgi:hypothetical protein
MLTIVKLGFGPICVPHQRHRNINEKAILLVAKTIVDGGDAHWQIRHGPRSHVH